MKKLLCGILAVMLVFSVFSACAETETPTNPTTTTTQAANDATTQPVTTTTAQTTEAMKEFSDYVGYWFLDMDQLLWQNRGVMTVNWAINISEAHSDGISVELYNGPYRQYKNDYLKFSPDSKKATFEVDWYDGEITLELKSDRIVCTLVNEETGRNDVVKQFTARTVYPEAYGAMMVYCQTYFKDRYDQTYWYAYDFGDGSELEIGELVIKQATTDGFNYNVTFDCSFGDYKASNVTARILDYKAHFTLNGKEAVLDFDNTGVRYGREIALCIDGEVVCNFNDRSLTRVGNGKNRDLSEYIGFWYYEDLELGDIFTMRGTAISEINIKAVNGNKVTFSFAIDNGCMYDAEDITVEVNGNLGVFEWEYTDMSGNEPYEKQIGKGVIRFDREGVYFSTFNYFTDTLYDTYFRYSLDDVRWDDYFASVNPDY